jgi:general nucleoside transport system ATP-binding protein
VGRGTNGMDEAVGGNGLLLDVRDLSKRFPGVKAVDAVSIALATGEIHALLGENGAGKSTLVKMLYGVLQPDSGSMQLAGVSYAPRRPFEARALGVGMVFQHFSLFDALTVTENIALGLPGATANAALADRIVQVSKSYGLDLEPSRQTGTLSAGERQRVEIVRCLLQTPRLLIMDEPTSVLTPKEATTLFATLRRLAADGCAVLYISHKLEEIRELCARATILRAGRVVGTCDPRIETAKTLAERMIGTTLQVATRPDAAFGPERLRVDQLSVPTTTMFGTSLKAVTFSVRGGEILGIAGVAGNGQVELMAALVGELTAGQSEAIRIDGVGVGRLGPIERRRCGMAFVPEDRLGHSAVPGLSLTENMQLSETRGGFLDWSALATAASGVVAQFGVKTAGVALPARSLSGGNLQKFIVGRELAQRPTVFIASQVTWGVDAGAASLIHQQIVALAEGGAAVVLISQDLDELFALAHTIAVIAGGRVSRSQPIEQVTAESIGLEMGAPTLA